MDKRRSLVYEMTLKSLGLFVGTGQCNANCKHCAGIIHRKHAPIRDGIIDEKLFYETLKKCYNLGARSISLSSSGEPTLSPLSVTKTLELICRMKNEGVNYDWINLYSNGIRIGEDKEFCAKHLYIWHKLGLQTIYVTVHDLNKDKNARLYGISYYPQLKDVVSRIHDAGMLARANLVLTKENIGTFEKYVFMVEGLRKIGFNHISAWPIRTSDDKLDDNLAPSCEELEKIGKWAYEHEIPNSRLRVLGEASRDSYEKGEKLTLFPNGALSNSWCN